MVRHLLIGFCSLPAIACGLFTPSPKTLNMAAGEYLLIATPVVCTTGDIRPGIGTLVKLSHEAREWVARSSSAEDGTVEFRFREVADARVAGVAVAGTLVGGGEDRRPFATAGAGLTFGGAGFGSAVLVSAQTTPSVPNWIGGSATGPVVFRDDARGQLTCTGAEIALRPPEGCELDATASCR